MNGVGVIAPIPFPATKLSSAQTRHQQNHNTAINPLKKLTEAHNLQVLTGKAVVHHHGQGWSWPAL